MGISGHTNAQWLNCAVAQTGGVIATPRLLAPLRHRDFALLWSGQTFSILGNSVNSIALPWQVLQLTGSATQMGIVVAINLATNVVFLLLGGAVVDRVPRRRILLTSDLISGLVFSTVAALAATGALRIEHLYLATAITAMTGAFFGPAMTAILPELVPTGILLAGNSLRGISRQAGRVFGPVLGGLIIAAAGLASAFAFDAFTFFVSFLALVAMRSAAPAPRPRPGMLHEVREGIAFVLARGWLWVTITIASVLNTFVIAAMSVALPVELKDTLGLDAAAFGAVFASQGIGEAAGAVLVGQLRVQRSGIAMYGFIAVSAVAMLAYAVPLLPVVLAAGLIWGATLVGFGVLWETAMQKHVPRELLGRVSSVDWFGSLVFSPIGPLAAGAVVTTYGPQFAFEVAAVLTVAAVPIGLSVRSIRELR